jgi:RimJ/RimL family protein N-acetyltransferase
LLRAFRRDDVANLVALDADPAIREFLDMPEAPTASQAEEWLGRIAANYPEGSARGYWAAEEDGRFVGWFHLRPSRDTGECEIGWRLRKDAWGRGLATEGGRALIDLAGERVIARTMAANLRSRRVMEKLEMNPVREFLYDDRLPCIEYATS